jgi:hypothetical protein
MKVTKNQELTIEEAAGQIAKSLFKCVQAHISKNLKSKTQELVNDLEDSDNKPSVNPESIPATGTSIINKSSKGINKVKEFLKKRKLRIAKK